MAFGPNAKRKRPRHVIEILVGDKENVPPILLPMQHMHRVGGIAFDHFARRMHARVGGKRLLQIRCGGRCGQKITPAALHRRAADARPGLGIFTPDGLTYRLHVRDGLARRQRPRRQKAVPHHHAAGLHELLRLLQCLIGEIFVGRNHQHAERFLVNVKPPIFNLRLSQYLQRHPVHIEQRVLQRRGEFLDFQKLAELRRVARKHQRYRTHMPPAGEHHAQPCGVISVHPIQRPARLAPAIIIKRRTILIPRSVRIKSVRHHEIRPANLHLVGHPFHLRIRQILAGRPENLAHDQMVLMVVHVRYRTGQLGRLHHRRRLLFRKNLPEHHIDAAHIAVLLQPHHVPGAKQAMAIQIIMLHEVPHRHHVMRPTPPTHPAVHPLAPRLGESIEILKRPGRVIVPGQIELVRRVRRLPIHTHVRHHRVEVRAPVARGLRLIVEKARYRLAEFFLEMIVMRLIHRLDEPVHAVLTGPVHCVLAALPQPRRGLPGEDHHFPRARRGVPIQLATVDHWA